jgi:predicted O-methyltransferase YrrM
MARRPVPLLTEGAIHFLEYYLPSRPSRMLEFGAGYSTRWFAEQCHFLRSIEHSLKWAEVAAQSLPPHACVMRRPRPYHGACSDIRKRSLDLVVVDGRDRLKCVQAALPLLKPFGVMMVDNMERENGRYKPIAELLSKFPRVDASSPPKDRWGFKGPNGWLTSWWIIR